MSGTDGDDPVVVFIANHPGLAERLLSEHFDEGGYCRCCAIGAQRGFHQFPCTIHAKATAAQRLNRRS